MRKVRPPWCKAMNETYLVFQFLSYYWQLSNHQLQTSYFDFWLNSRTYGKWPNIFPYSYPSFHILLKWILGLQGAYLILRGITASELCPFQNYKTTLHIKVTKIFLWNVFPFGHLSLPLGNQGPRFHSSILHLHSFQVKCDEGWTKKNLWTGRNFKPCQL